MATQIVDSSGAAHFVSHLASIGNLRAVLAQHRCRVQHCMALARTLCVAKHCNYAWISGEWAAGTTNEEAPGWASTADCGFPDYVW